MPGGLARKQPRASTDASNPRRNTGWEFRLNAAGPQEDRLRGRGNGGMNDVEKQMSTDTSLPILVVDDYNTMVRIIKKLLKQIGYENVDDAANGEEALAKIKGKQYGLIISDWNMEPMTGFDLLKHVRADDATAKTPFILVTAESKPENVLAAQRAGVSNYLIKPFSAPVLKEKIDSVLNAA
jgi:two-component system chemotaxis response regulator CheY